VATRTGLSTAELERIRDTLAAGRKPKVVFTEAAGQIAGQTGQVVELTDPQLSDEWLVVRFGRDELPFSPGDLAIAPKAVPASRATPAGNATPASKAVPAGGAVPARRPAGPHPELPADPPFAVPAPREESPVTSPAPSTVDTSNGKGSPARAAKAVPAAAKAAGAPPKPPAAEPTPAAAPEAAPAKPAARKAAKPKPPAALTVTLAYSDGEWTVAAQQGAKALARPYVIKPTEALKMVGMLDVPGVHEAVEEIVAAARSRAEAEAGRLRAELAEVEARLAELRETG